MKNKIPRKLSLVKYISSEALNPNTGLVNNRIYIFLGEISNMPEHCVVIEHKSTHKIFSGYHTNNFVELNEEEV